MGTLRLLLAIAVINSHAETYTISGMLSGGAAVHLFFIISGFYMALILTKKYHSTALFYSNRFLRLYPTYALVLLATIVWFAIEWTYTHHWPPPTWIGDATAEMPLWQWTAIEFSNLTMIGQDLSSLFHWKAGEGFLFLTGDSEPSADGAQWAGHFRWVGQAWTIGTEIWFYLLAPFLVRRSAYIQIAIALASAAFIPLINKWTLLYFSFPANLWFFLVGSLLYRWHSTNTLALPQWGGLAALGYVVIAGFTVGLIENEIIHNAMLIVMALCIPLLFGRFAGGGWDNAVGNLSYPVYLDHSVVTDVLFTTSRIQSGIIISGISILVAVLIVCYVENPIDKYRQQRARDTIT